MVQQVGNSDSDIDSKSNANDSSDSHTASPTCFTLYVGMHMHIQTVQSVKSIIV